MSIPSASSKIILTAFKFFWACSIFFEHSQNFWSWSKARFYLINLHIWAWSKIFEHGQKIFELAGGIGNRQSFFKLALWNFCSRLKLFWINRMTGQRLSLTCFPLLSLKFKWRTYYVLKFFCWGGCFKNRIVQTHLLLTKSAIQYHRQLTSAF